jgi:lysophospholipase L1-like esterase
MRWRDVPLAKPPGKRRVAILGDSFAFGCWSDTVEDSLAGIFERNISPARWEVLNFGVGGYGPADEELQLEEQVLGFAPDYVVVVFFAGNDFRDAFLGTDKAGIVDGTAQLRDDLVRARVPAAELAEDVTLSRPTPATGLRRGLERLALFRRLAPLLGLERLQLEFAVNRNFTMFTYWSQHPYPEAALRARDATLASYERMRDSLRTRGARFGIVAVPYKEQVHSRVAAGAGFDVTLPQLWVQAHARQHGIPYLDLLPLLRDRALRSGERLFHANDIHLNQQGHRLAGEAMADWFRCCLRDAAP